MQPRVSDENFRKAAPGADAGLASDREFAALAWTEATFLTAAIAALNAWNRLRAGLRFAPLALRSAEA